MKASCPGRKLEYDSTYKVTNELGMSFHKSVLTLETTRDWHFRVAYTSCIEYVCMQSIHYYGYDNAGGPHIDWPSEEFKYIYNTTDWRLRI